MIPRSAFFKSSSPSFDEELLDLKEELAKQHQLFDDTVVMINKIQDRLGIENILTADKRLFFNNTPKNQEILRVKFIGNLLKNLTYYNSMETFLDDFYEKREKLLFANKDPNEIRNYIRKRMSKKVKILETVVRNFAVEGPPKELRPNNEIRLDVSASSVRTRSQDKADVLQEVVDRINEEREIIAKIEAVNFLEKRNEDELITEKHLYENFKQQMHDNLGFLDDNALEGLVNEVTTDCKIKKKVSVLKIFALKLPHELFFEYTHSSSPEEFFSKSKNGDLFAPTKSVLVPLKLEEITKKLINLSKELGINEDVGRDNGAYLLFTIENYFKRTYREQSRFLEFTSFRYRNDGEPIGESEFKVVGFEVLLEDSLKRLFSSPESTKEIMQKKRLESFSDSLVSSWMNCLLINDENDAFFFVEKKSREYYEQHEKELYLPEIYFEFFKGFLKLLLLNSRKSLINIFSYCNFLRHFELNLKQSAQTYDSTHSTTPKTHKPPQFKIIFEFDDNDFLKVLERDSRHSLIHHASFGDFMAEVAFIKNSASFSVHFSQKPIKLKPGTSELESPVFDNINRQELLDELLQYHCRFLKEKAKILVKLSEIMGQATDFPRFREFIGFSLGVARTRPEFPLFKDEVFRTYLSSINNLEVLGDLVKNVIDFQKKAERKMWKRRNYEHAMFQVLLGQEKPQKHLLFGNQIIKTLSKIAEGQELVSLLFKDSPCELERSRIEGIFLRKTNDFFTTFTDVPPFLTDFTVEISSLTGNFLETDEILDEFSVYRRFLEYIQKGSFESKTDSPKLRKSLQASTLTAKDKLILALNLMEFLRFREKIRMSVYSLNFSLRVFRKQQEVFIRDPVKIENIIGVNNMANFLKALLSLDSLKCNIDLLNFKNWILYLINQKKMDEPFLFLQYIFSLEQILGSYTIANNLYYQRLRLEFPVEADLQRKIAESSEFFLDVFEKKRNAALRILQFKGVSAFTGNPLSQNNETSAKEKEKDAKMFNKNVNYNPFFTKGYKSPNAQTISDFTTIINKENYYQILKINAILLRNELERLNNRFPSRIKLLKVNKLKPITPPRISLPASKLAGKPYQDKRPSSEKPSDFPSSLLNLEVLPSIEEISRFKSEDIPVFGTSVGSQAEKRSRDSHVIAESREEVRPKGSSFSKRRSSILLTPASQLSVFKRSNRKEVLRQKEFHYLRESPVYLLMNILFHLLNILGFELLRRMPESAGQDLLFFMQGIMDEAEFKRRSNQSEGFEDLKRNIVRVSSKLQFIRDEIDGMEKNIAVLHEKSGEKSAVNSAFGKEVLSYLKTIHKRQYNLVLMALIVDYQDNPLARALIEEFCFNKLSDGIEKLGSKGPKHNSATLFYEQSPKMIGVEEVFLAERSKPDFSEDLVVFFNRNNLKTFELLQNFTIKSEAKFRKRLLSHCGELNKVLILRNSDTEETPDPLGFGFVGKSKKNLQINIRSHIFRLIASLASGKSENEVNQKIGFLERIMEKDQKLKVLLDPEKNKPLELSKFVQDEGIVKTKLDFLSNEIEKAFIRESIWYYAKRTQIYSQFINSKNYCLRLVDKKSPTPVATQRTNMLSPMLSLSPKSPTIVESPGRMSQVGSKDKINQILQAFSAKFMASASVIDIFQVGKGYVIPIKTLREEISNLNLSFLTFLEQSFNYFLLPLFQQTSGLKSSLQTQSIHLLNLRRKRDFLSKAFSEIVESLIAKKSSDLLFSLDHLYKSLNYMKDEEALREQEIKKITRNEFSERIVDKKNDINIVNSRFEDYKTGMTYDLTKYIEEAKTEAQKVIQKRNAFRPSFLTRFTQIFKGPNSPQETDRENNGSLSVRYSDKAKLYKTFHYLRAFFILRHQVLKQKFFREIEEKNQKFISSEVLWNKIKDLEKSESRIKDLLINSEKEIAVLEHQNLILKKDVRSITLEKVQLYKANNLQRGQILELEENFAVLKRKKYIDNPDTEGMVKANTRPMSSAAAKLLRQQTELFALENQPISPSKSGFSLVANRTVSAKKPGISAFGGSKQKPKLLGRTQRQGGKGKDKRRENLGYESEIFVRKSFKITTGSCSNLNFYAKTEKNEEGKEEKGVSMERKKGVL